MKNNLLLIIFAFLFLLPVSANAALTAEQQAIVKKAETYLNDLGTGKARFLQTAPNGAQLIGTFYLDRPGKLRFEYDDPIKDFVVADGFLIYFYDAELGEQTNAPIGQTLADFLLRPHLSLYDELQVFDFREGKELYQIAVTQSADPDVGSIVLGFTKEPFALKKWRITDSAGSVTEIELYQMQTGVDLDRDLFIYVDPEKYTAPRYND